MKKIVTIIVAVIAVMFMVILSGCEEPNSSESSEKISIGFISPLTGDVAPVGESARGGMELALEDINAAGGINGKRVEGIYEDSACKPQLAVLAIQKLINEDHIKVIVGAGCSSEVLAAAPIAEENKVILLGYGSSSPDITHAGDYIFRTWPSDTEQGKAIADELIKKSIVKVAIINANSDYNLGLAKAFQEAYEKQKGTVVIQEIYEQEASDFRAQLTKIKGKEKDVDALVIIPYMEAGLLMKQARGIGIALPFYASETVGSEEIIKEAAGAAEGVVYATAKFNEDAPSTNTFLERYEKKYGRKPVYPAFAANAYDATRLLADALSTGESTENVKQYLYNVKDYPGIAGMLTIDENGDALKESQLMIIQNGKIENYN